MKQIFAATSMLAASFSPTAFAASTANISITGSVTLPACEPRLANAGLIDYGKVSASDVLEQAQNKFFRFEFQSLQLSITCT